VEPNRLLQSANRRRRTGALLALVAGVALLAAPTAGASPYLTTVTSSQTINAFSPSTVTMVQGELLEFVNQNRWGTPHNVTSDDLAPNGRPIFGTPMTTIWGTAPVLDAEKLPPGTYGFHCTIHAWLMTGTLIVVAQDGSSPVPPPLPQTPLP
jgi:plastocyanin